MDNFNSSVLSCIRFLGSDLNEIPLTFDDEVLEAYLRTVLVRYGGMGTPFL